MRVWWAGCLLLGACNTLLGLDDTVREERDLDRDGVDDDIDNCPGLPNPLQLPTDCVQGLVCETDGARTSLDSDRDGVDDGCDACLRGPSIDEDGDGIADACDPCPTTKQSASDRDGDGIGDDCDLAPAVPQERLLFDGFNGTMTSLVWDASLGWTVGHGAVSTTGGGTLLVRDLQIAGDADGTWSIELGVDPPPTATSGDEIGVYLGLAGAPLQCKVFYTGTGWRVRLGTSMSHVDGITDFTGGITLRASLVHKALLGPEVQCAADAEAVSIPNDSAPGPFVATFYITRAGAFRYVEIQGRR